MKIENLDTALFTDGTKIIINGEWCSWSGAWDDSSIYIGTVTSGTCEGSWSPVSVYEAGNFATCAAGLSGSNPDWANMRIAKKYNVDAGNGTLTITDAQVNDGEYIIYVNMEGVAVGDDITWEIKAKE